MVGKARLVIMRHAKSDWETGAESDLVQVTNIARSMVGRWGMSDAVGPLSVLPADQQQYPFGGQQVAPETQELVDTEVRRIVDECYSVAIETLKAHRDQLDALAQALLEKETLEEEEAYEIAGVSRE